MGQHGRRDLRVDSQSRPAVSSGQRRELLRRFESPGSRHRRRPRCGWAPMTAGTGRPWPLPTRSERRARYSAGRRAFIWVGTRQGSLLQVDPSTTPAVWSQIRRPRRSARHAHPVLGRRSALCTPRGWEPPLPDGVARAQFPDGGSPARPTPDGSRRPSEPCGSMPPGRDTAMRSSAGRSSSGRPPMPARRGLPWAGPSRRPNSRRWPRRPCGSSFGPTGSA